MEWFNIIWMSAAAGLCIPLGGFIASREHIHPDWLEKEFRHFIIALGGGVLLGAVALVLVPEGISYMQHSLLAIPILLGGGLTFFILERSLALRRREAPQLSGMLLDYLPESLALGGIMVANSPMAPLLALFIGLQNLPEGFNTFRELRGIAHYSADRVLYLMLGLVPLGPVFAMAGYVFLSDAPDVAGGIMLFASGGILYIIFSGYRPAITDETSLGTAAWSCVWIHSGDVCSHARDAWVIRSVTLKVGGKIMSNRSIGLSEPLYEYLLKHSLRESEVLQQLRQATEHETLSEMRSAPEQGQFMALLLHLTGARRVLEVGTYTGYASLWMAEALPDDGELITCDISTTWTSVATQFWRQAGLAHKIKLRLAPATETLNQLIAAGEDDSFDFAFIDADKENYEVYFEQCLQLVKSGGLILIDNVLWGGSVIYADNQSSATNAIRAFNEKRLQDDRVELSMLPVADGLTLLRKT
ncbi:putative O-methyltransferase/MSMEI_4947 [Mariprofundus micogutta]|uniref:Putative O-methyltransferase/MSMEI_4947 n=1 Tax=Mariprofundus micogutta TaxID=1921010 RepID=A0A1L8CQ54_9PROT|nr:class I SAM-dependent methyltransferase [Mariprofundus micogutta]GAV21014.1 putative O-methyltransferase/MSMEI_4947 [Mariprofundus micogutta]